jgi:hypothetical protein
LDCHSFPLPGPVIFSSFVVVPVSRETAPWNIQELEYSRAGIFRSWNFQGLEFRDPSSILRDRKGSIPRKGIHSS